MTCASKVGSPNCRWSTLAARRRHTSRAAGSTTAGSCAPSGRASDRRPWHIIEGESASCAPSQPMR
eukprot:scaffold11435_cov30-Tisochrysis_lutea.AAC.4